MTSDAKASAGGVAPIDAERARIVVTLPKVLGALAAAVALGVTIGGSWARIALHEQHGHERERDRIQAIELTLAKVAAVLERLERRSHGNGAGGTN